MRAEIYNLRQHGDLSHLLRLLDTQDLRDQGIHINERELLFAQMAPWLIGLVLYIDGDFAGYATIDLSEVRYGRGKIVEFYIVEKCRITKTAYNFYHYVLEQFINCHRIITMVKATNSKVAVMLSRHGWNIEGTLKNYDRDGKTYYQLSLTRAGKVKNG